MGMPLCCVYKVWYTFTVTLAKLKSEAEIACKFQYADFKGFAIPYVTVVSQKSCTRHAYQVEDETFSTYRDALNSRDPGVPPTKSLCALVRLLVSDHTPSSSSHTVPPAMHLRAASSELEHATSGTPAAANGGHLLRP